MDSDIVQLFRKLLLWVAQFIPCPSDLYDPEGDERSPSEIADPPEHIIEEEDFTLAYDSIRFNGDAAGYRIHLKSTRWIDAGFLSRRKKSVWLTTPSGVAYQSLPSDLGCCWQRLRPPHTSGRAVPEAKLDLAASFFLEPLPGGGKGIPDLVAMLVLIMVATWFVGLRPTALKALGPSILPKVVEVVPTPPPVVDVIPPPADEVFTIPDEFQNFTEGNIDVEKN